MGKIKGPPYLGLVGAKGGGVGKLKEKMIVTVVVPSRLLESGGWVNLATTVAADNPMKAMEMVKEHLIETHKHGEGKFLFDQMYVMHRNTELRIIWCEQ